MQLLILSVTALPAVLCALLTWRLFRQRQRACGILAAVLTLVCVFFHPGIQMAADVLIAYPYAKKKEALALEHEIVGKNYAYVVAKLGSPNRVRVESPTVVRSATREITEKVKTYQAMDYFVSPSVYTATRFIVFLDEKGMVTSHRVKWEYGEGR